MSIHKIVRCPACGSEDLVSIEMTMDGAAVQFRACHLCEHRWWEKDGSSVELGSVVPLIPRR
jgi:formate dehydrogenase maturation protein FdhE